MADEIKIKAPSVEQNINVNVTGEAEIHRLYTELQAAQASLDRVNSTLQSTETELDRVRSQFDDFAHGNGIDILQGELERFKNTAEQSVDEFRAFLQSVNLNDAWGNNDWQFSDLFEQIKDGSITASQAILRVKTDYRALMEEAYQESGGMFDTQMVQGFTAALDHLGETIGIVVERLNSIEQNGVKAVGGSGGGDVANVLSQIENAARGMSEEVKGSYESITSLVNAMNEYANLDSTRILGVSQAFRNIADIGKGSYGTKSIENIVYLTKQLQALSASGSSIRFDFTGFNDLKVSKASVSNLATYLPQIASVNVSKLEKLSQVNLTNFNNVKVSKSAIENISRLTEAIQVLKEVKAASVKADESSINITGGEREKQDTSHYKDATRAVKEYYAMLTQLGKAKSDVTLTSEGWKSESGQWDELAAALNRTKTAFDLYTSSENQSKLTAEEKVNLLRLLTTESERYVLSIEAQANKEQEAAEKAARKAEEKAERERAAAEKAASSKEAAAQKAAAAAEAAEARKQEAAKMSDAQIENNLLKIEKLQTSINGAITNANALGIDSEELARLRELSAELETLKTNTQNGSVTNKDFADSLTKIRLSADIAGAAVKRDADEMGERLIPGTTEFGAAQQELARKTTQAQNALRGFTAAEKSTKETSRAAYSTIKNQVERYKELEARLSSGEMTQEEFANAVKKSSGIVAENIRIIKENGDAHETTGEKIKGAIAKFSQWFSVTRVVMAAYRTMKKMVSAVIEVDTAMTELRKVTDETENTYDRFLENATKRAKALGATLTDTINATADFARLGYTLEESSQLADAAIVYKNVGDGIEDIGEASESVISTMKAFGVEASDAMLIVDKFNEVGNNFAISSKGVGDALVRSASAMHAANNTLDETIALITTANTVVQNPDSVGTAMKTLSMYLRAAKTEAEEAGESTEGMANSVSELRGEILALTGGKVDIQIDEDSFKSTYQIIKELSEVWGELTDISRANILEMIGGKRNSNVVSALIENFQLAEDVMKSSANAAGSATAENEKYLESIQGHIDVLKASFETFSTDLINSNLIKFLVDAGNGIINLLDSATRLHLLLPAILATITLIKGTGIVKMVMESASKVTSLSASLITEKTVTDSLAASVSNLTIRQKQQVATNILNAMSSGQLTEIEGKQMLTTLGLAAADGTLTVANKGLATSFKSLMASIPVFGWIALAISVVIEAVTVLASIIDTTSSSIADLDSELDSLTTTAKNTANEFSNLKSNADDIIPRFAELAKGVNDFGENVSLTDEEYEEFWKLNNKLAEMFPELDAGLDSNGNHILTLSYSVNSLTESLNALVEAERAAANEKIAGNMKDTLKNMKSADKQYGKEKKALQTRVDAYKEASDEINRMYREQDKYREAYGDRWEEQYQLDTSGYVTQMQQAFGSSSDQSVVDAWQKMVDKYKIPGGDYGEIDWHAVINSDEFKNQMAAVDREMDSIEKKQSARWQKINPIMGAWVQTTDSYAAAEENVQTLLSKVIGNIDYSKIGITNEKKLKEYVQKNFVDPIADAAPEVQNAMVGLFDIKSAFDSGALTVGEYGITDYILGDLKKAGISDEILSNLKVSLNLDEFNNQLNVVKNGIDGTDEEVQKFVNDLTYNDFNLVYSVISENGKMSIDELQEKIKQLRYESAAMVEPLNFTDFLEGLDAAADGVDKVVSAMEKLANGTELTKKEMMDLIAKYPELLQQADIFADGSVEAQKNALNSILDMQEQEYDAQIDAKIAELEATEQVLDDQLELEEEKANLINDIKNMEVNGKVTQEKEFLNKLNEFNDLQGQNFVSLVDGEVQVNEEALNDQLKQGADFGEASAENIWEPLGQTIVSSHEQGYTGALTATNNYTTSLWSRIKNFFGNIGSAIANAWNDMWSGNWKGIGTYFSQAVGTGTGSVSGGTVSVNFGGSATTINGVKVDDWVSQQEKASKERIAKINEIKGNTLTAINNLKNLKGLKLTDIYASGSSGSSGKKDKDTDKDEENIFKTMYNYHKHLVEMEQETTADFLKWLDDAYKAAYKAGEITLDEYYKY